MSEVFERIKRGLEEAIAHSKDEPTDIQMFIPQQEDDKEAPEKTAHGGAGQG